LKYLIRDWGIEKFREHVQEYYGKPLETFRDVPIQACIDPLGWTDQEDGRWCYGLNIENGRVVDNEKFRLKSALRAVCQQLNPSLRITAQQSLLICDLTPDQKPQLEAILAQHKIKRSEDYSTVRRWSLACVAWPTCSLAITESERALPGILDELEVHLDRLGLSEEAINIRMTGCPNGCARPYNAEIGLVGKAKEKYTLYLGGSHLGTRLAYVYKDLVPADTLVAEIVSVLEQFKSNRIPGEAFGDFCDRVGQDSLLEACAA